MTRISKMYSTLMVRSVPLSEATYRAAFETAVREKDEPLLIELASVPSLPEDLLSTISKHKSAKVQVAYLSRTDRKEEELFAALKKEKRVTVLSAIAENEEASPLLLKAVANTLDEKGSVAVAAALAFNAKSPKEALRKAIMTLVKESEKVSYQNMHKLKEIVKKNPSLHNDIALVAPKSFLPQLISSTALNDKSFDLLVKRLVETPVAACRHSVANSDPSYAYVSWEAKQVTALARRHALILAQNSDLSLNHKTRIAKAFSKVPLAPAERQELDSLLGTSNSKDMEVLKEKNLLATTSQDKDVLSSLVDECLQALNSKTFSTTPTKERLEYKTLSLLALNPFTSSDDLIRMVNCFDYQQLHEIIALRPEEEIVKSFVSRSFRALTDPKVQKALFTSNEETARWVGILTKLDRTDFVMLSLADLGILSGKNLLEVRWLALLSFLNVAPLEVQKAAADALSEALKEDKSAWETFTTLGESYEGSFKELLEVCVIVS